MRGEEELNEHKYSKSVVSATKKLNQRNKNLPIGNKQGTKESTAA